MAQRPENPEGLIFTDFEGQELPEPYDERVPRKSDHFTMFNQTSLPYSPLNKAIVSDHMGFGSFSGADIKVIVHFPHDHAAFKRLQEEIKLGRELIIEQEQAIIAKEDEIEARINGQNRFIALQQRSGDTRSIMSDIEELTVMRQTLAAMLEQEKKEHEEYNKLKNIPSSKVLGEVQSVSWSIFREKSPVRTLGSVYPRSYVRGPRTIGGTFVFTIFHKHVMSEILDLNLGVVNTGTFDRDTHQYTTNLIDQLPPLDISLLFANEYGALSHMGIWGVEFLQEGATFSIEDLFSESVVQYVARDLDPMRLVNERRINGQGVSESWTLSASALASQKNSLYKNRTGIRRNPFI